MIHDNQQSGSSQPVGKDNLAGMDGLHRRTLTSGQNDALATQAAAAITAPEAGRYRSADRSTQATLTGSDRWDVGEGADAFHCACDFFQQGLQFGLVDLQLFQFLIAGIDIGIECGKGGGTLISGERQLF